MLSPVSTLRCRGGLQPPTASGVDQQLSITWESTRKAECRALPDTAQGAKKVTLAGGWVTADIRRLTRKRLVYWGELMVAGTRMVAVKVLLRGLAWGICNERSANRII